MKAILALLAAVAMIGSAAAWDISEELQYTYTKTGYEQAGSGIIDQFVGTTSGAYAEQPNTVYGEGWLKIDNTLVGVEIDREQGPNGLVNPAYTAENNNFYTQLTQGGDAKLSFSAQDTVAGGPEISGEASAYQNLWVGGEFARTSADFDSRAIVGFSDIPDDAPTETDTRHFVVTDVISANAEIDADTYGAGYFNTANMGVKVDADIKQDYVGSGWAEPTYSGGITMWANFDGACDPHCSNPIETSVEGSAWTAIFPPDADQLAQGLGTGEEFYWGELWKTNPQATAGDWNSAWDSAPAVPAPAPWA